MNHKPPRRILLAVIGLTAQIVTETIYALACRADAPWIPDEVHVITTTTGAENTRLNLLIPGGWFHRLCSDYRLPPISFPESHIHIVANEMGTGLEDIRTPVQNTEAADFITDTVRRLTEDRDTELHVSIAGGRKTMGYYLGYALSLYGRSQDRLSHVLVSDPYETNREFYYPTPYDYPIHSRRGDKSVTVDARNARVDLAEIPFVRLRDGLPDELLNGVTSFSRVVAAAQRHERKLELVIDLSARSVTANCEPVKLPPKEFSLLVWLARRRTGGFGPVHCDKKADVATATGFLEVCRKIYGSHSVEMVGFESALEKGMDSTWFSPAKTRLHKALVQALGKSGAEPYRIRATGKGKGAWFELGLSPEQIEIKENT